MLRKFRCADFGPNLQGGGTSPPERLSPGNFPLSPPSCTPMSVVIVTDLSLLWLIFGNGDWSLAFFSIFLFFDDNICPHPWYWCRFPCILRINDQRHQRIKNIWKKRVPVTGIMIFYWSDHFHNLISHSIPSAFVSFQCQTICSCMTTFEITLLYNLQKLQHRQSLIELIDIEGSRRLLQ